MAVDVSMENSIFCRKCGVKVPKWARFCHKCGATIAINNPNNQVQSAPQKDVANKRQITNDVKHVTKDGISKIKKQVSSIKENPQEYRANLKNTISDVAKNPAKKKNKKIIFGAAAALVIIIVVIVLFSGSSIYGTWEMVGDPRTTLTFNEDGTGQRGHDGAYAPTTWFINGNSLVIDDGDMPMPFEYRIRGRTLTLTGGLQMTMEFTRR